MHVCLFIHLLIQHSFCSSLSQAGVAYELLKIAKHLTDNDEDFALYIADPNWDNFGVDSSGKVRILDAENIIVVDKLAVEASECVHEISPMMNKMRSV